MKEGHNWGWPIASYLFLGGLGGGMIVVVGLADLAFDRGEPFSLGSLIAGIAIAIGSALLIFELGRPFQFWRVLSRQKAIMTAGAWLLSFTIVTSFAYFSFWPEFSPWRQLVGLRHLAAGINIVLGLGVCIYTGILLGSLRTRAFWNTPLLPVLFLVSGISTGVAAQSLLAGSWPCHVPASEIGAVHAALRSCDLALLIFELILVFVYIGMMRFSAGPVTARIAAQWLTGRMRWPFWGGLVGLGLALPGVLYGLSSGASGEAAPFLVLIGGVVLRFLVVYSDERARLPGESEYYARLPGPDAPFLKAWE
ncbi:MAG: NrfD/PsrC family molybdoenzyme membrane anchor subunit [Syntrophorhabdales bacterium]